VEAKFKVGDLVMLNEFGQLVLESKTTIIGLITRGPINLTYPLYPAAEEKPFSFWAYDVMVGDQLLTEVPQEFLNSLVETD